MKKAIILFLTLVLLLSVRACGTDDGSGAASKEESAKPASKDESSVLVIDDSWRDKTSDDFLINQLEEATDTELITVRVWFEENFTEEDVIAETSIDETWNEDQKNQAYRETRDRFVKEYVESILTKYKEVAEYELISKYVLYVPYIDIKATKENIKAFGCIPEISHMYSLDKEEPQFSGDESCDISESSDYSE